MVDLSYLLCGYFKVLDEGRAVIALTTANTDLAGQIAVAVAVVRLSAKQNTAPKGF